MSIKELTYGVYSWRATHPEWHTKSERVASHVLLGANEMFVVDPLLDQEPEKLIKELMYLRSGRRCGIYITIPYHVRDTSYLSKQMRIPVYGHPALAKRLDPQVASYDASQEIFRGFEALRVGNPIRYEMPLYHKQTQTIAFGDLVVGINGGLRVWGDVKNWTTKLRPTLLSLLDLDVKNVLVAHGEHIIGDAHEALVDMLEQDPVKFNSKMLQGDARNSDV